MYQIIITHVPNGRRFFSRFMPNEGRVEVEQNIFKDIARNIPIRIESVEGTDMYFPAAFMGRCVVEFMKIATND